MGVETLGVIASFLVAIGAMIVALYKGLHSVTRSEMTMLIAENKRLQERITVLETKLASRDDRIETLEKQVDDLQTENRELKQQVIVLHEEVERYRNRRKPGQ